MLNFSQFRTNFLNPKNPKKLFYVLLNFPVPAFMISSIFLGIFFIFMVDGAFASSVKKLTFPKDHLEHKNFDSEWWYLNLSVIAENTKTGKVKNFAYIISMSRINGQYAILSSKYDNSNKRFAEKTEVGGSINATAKNGYINISYTKNKNYGMRLSENKRKANGVRSYKLSGNTPQVGKLNLNLTERSYSKYTDTKPLLWGCDGVISVFEDDDTFYYSIVDLNVSGKITEGIGNKVQVYKVLSGKAWIDHQWFNAPSSISPLSFWRGHYWSGFHYSKGKNPLAPMDTAAMGVVVQIFSDGPKYSYWVKRNFNGKNECGSKATVKASQFAANGFPQRLNITLLDQKSNQPFARIQGNVFSSNQVVKVPIGPQFLEASSYFRGTVDKSKVNGVGIIETHLTK